MYVAVILSSGWVPSLYDNEQSLLYQLGSGYHLGVLSSAGQSAKRAGVSPYMFAPSYGISAQGPGRPCVGTYNALPSASRTFPRLRE